MITLRCGRKVRLEEYGDLAGAPALWFHGGFSSRLEATPLDVPARELGLRIISLDRPGFGGSDPLPGRTVTGYASDVVEVLDALGIERAAVGGLSNGGMYTMAVASQIPDRVLHAVPLNPTTPVADAAARAGLPRGGRMAYAMMARNPEQTAKRAVRSASPGRIAAAVNRLTNPDAPLLDDNPLAAAAWAANLAEAQRQPESGSVVTELRQATSPWGFDHRAVEVPVTLVSGEKDAGLGYARAWATELPQGRLVVLPGGHTNILAPAVAQRIAELLLGHP
ncbi:hypothetical protein ADL30_23755 [Streptomyces sp. NRRL S-1521]|nr:hypothetical protein ADL30_23755 [Streptomyces sp. NRRL S-1521]